MARLHEEIIVIKVSTLLRDDALENSVTILNAETLQSLEAVVQELAGVGTLVEIQVA